LGIETGFAGLGFIDADTPEFASLREHLDKAIEKAWTATLPQLADRLQEQLRREPMAFIGAVSVDGRGAAEFWNVPILNRIPASAFVDALLAARPELQRDLLQ